ncbi:diguanylate cyclase [Candidatus Omnitrophota bacterium]
MRRAGQRRYLPSNLILALFVASLILFLSQGGFLKQLELSGLDFSFKLRGALPSNPQIVIIEINDKDIAKVGRWPWDRSWHGLITRALSDMGAKYIYFDIIFSEASSEKDDSLFEESIKHSKNVYLPLVFQDRSLDANKALFPIERFSNHIKGTGSINIYPDIDGTFRRIPLVFQSGTQAYPHAALKLAMDYKGLSIKEVQQESLLLAGRAEEIEVPLVEKNTMLINWAGKWQDTFKHYGFLETLAAYDDFRKGKPTQINLEDFKDSICMVAVTAIGLYDIQSVPLQPEYPGIGILATTVNNILNKDFLRTPPLWISILILYILTLLPAFLISGERPLHETIFVLVAAGVYFTANLLLFKKGIVLSLYIPITGLFAGSLTVGTYKFIRVAVERKRFFKLAISDVLTGLYNVGYFKVLLNAEFMAMKKQDPHRRFSVIMFDVDHFKKFNDTYGHQVGDLVLREVSSVLGNSVRSSDVVARYGGEEIIALLRGSNIKNALDVAEKMRKNVEEHTILDGGQTYKVTVSVGVSTFHPGDDDNSIIKRADEGLYKSKEGGRNRVSTEEGIDHLTGLYNQAKFTKIMDMECEMSKAEVKKEFTLMLVSIDKLQDHTNNLGVEEENLILKGASAVMEKFVRCSDIIGEYDKRKIAVLLRGASSKDNKVIAENIKKEVEKSQIQGKLGNYRLTISAGLSAFVAGDNAKSIIERANMALTEAEKSEGNSVCKVEGLAKSA